MTAPGTNIALASDRAGEEKAFQAGHKIGGSAAPGSHSLLVLTAGQEIQLLLRRAIIR
jgi:hypothetical protein